MRLSIVLIEKVLMQVLQSVKSCEVGLSSTAFSDPQLTIMPFRQDLSRFKYTWAIATDIAGKTQLETVYS